VRSPEKKKIGGPPPISEGEGFRQTKIQKRLIRRDQGHPSNQKEIIAGQKRGPERRVIDDLGGGVRRNSRHTKVEVENHLSNLPESEGGMGLHQFHGGGKGKKDDSRKVK